MRCTTTTTTVLLAAALWAAVSCRAVTVGEIVGQINPNSYSNWMANLYAADGQGRFFTTSGTPRVPDPDFQHDLARNFIFDSFEAMGYETWLDPFGFVKSGVPYTNCNNVVAVKRGAGGTNVYIVGAHYDSVDATRPPHYVASPGADDNASGVAGLLEAARVLQDVTFRDTIVFIAFDAEETGNNGSQYFVANNLATTLSATNATTFYKAAVKGMVSADMIAFNGSGGGSRVSIYGGSNIQRAGAPGAGSGHQRYTANEAVNVDSTYESDHHSFHHARDRCRPADRTRHLDNPHYHSHLGFHRHARLPQLRLCSGKRQGHRGLPVRPGAGLPPATLAIVRIRRRHPGRMDGTRRRRLHRLWHRLHRTPKPRGYPSPLSHLPTKTPCCPSRSTPPPRPPHLQGRQALPGNHDEFDHPIFWCIGFFI
jgi:hypothetical protein